MWQEEGGDHNFQYFSQRRVIFHPLLPYCLKMLLLFALFGKASHATVAFFVPILIKQKIITLGNLGNAFVNIDQAKKNIDQNLNQYL